MRCGLSERELTGFQLQEQSIGMMARQEGMNYVKNFNHGMIFADGWASSRFQYLCQPVLLTPNSLKGTQFEDIVPSVIHFISYPAPRAGIVLDEINNFRTSKRWSPLIVWEPEDESLEAVTSIASHVDILG